jgi:hypothetical protein
LTSKCDLGGRDQSFAPDNFLFLWLFVQSIFKIPWPLTSKCDLDLGGRWPVVTHETSSQYCEQLWQVFTKSLSKIRKLWTRHDIYPQIDNVDLEWASATLTLEVGSGCWAWHIVLLLQTFVLSDFKFLS